MLLVWRVRYLDSRDKKFKDRDLFLDTSKLPTETRITVEIAHKLIINEGQEHGRKMLPHRYLFHEADISASPLCDQLHRESISSFYLFDYFENENSKELSQKEMAVIITGRPDAIMLRGGTPLHHVELALGDSRPIPIAEITLSQQDLDIFGTFVRDWRELIRSPFFKEGPGTLVRHPLGGAVHQTAVTKEEITSFVTTFRRLYMENEPANFLKTASLLARILHDNPLGDWINGEKEKYTAELLQEVHHLPFSGVDGSSFTQKRLIDVFIYTLYAHQTNKERENQFERCLAAVANVRPILDWLFLWEMLKSSRHICDAGTVIADVYEHYCEYHKVSGKVIPPMLDDNLGILENKEEREARIIREISEKHRGG